MNVWRRCGLVRTPVVTMVIFAITATVNAVQFAVPGTLSGLQRTPAGMHGDWWRSFTSLFVQDGGVFGTASNLAFLLIIGMVAEQVVSRPWWVTGYLGAGLVGELFGYLWQPVGGGNSVAICGLAGAVTVAVLLRNPAMPRGGFSALMLWLGALLATWFPPLIAVGIAGAGFVQNAEKRGAEVTAIVVATAVGVGLLLCAVQNIHGAALLTGLLIAASTVVLSRRRPVLAGRA
jgi:membrane associated rhomboid family serine protease